MKKIITLFTVLAICLSMVFSVGHVFAAKNTEPLTIMDLIRLKKHIIADSDYNSDFDYNKDKRVNALDLIVLKRIILGVYNAPENNEAPKIDEDGYYNELVKP